MKNKIEIFCTLGPSSLNKKFLKLSEKKIDLLRLNISHIKIENLERIIKKIKNYSKLPICIDTEGAQIRTKIKKKINLKIGHKIKFFQKGKVSLYPDIIFSKIKIGDLLSIGFDGLIIKIIKKANNLFYGRAVSKGKLENNKGVTLLNRKIKLDYLTKKDLKAIKIANKLKIKNFALSFTNSYEDIKKFNKLLPNKRKIYKIESRSALKNWKKILKFGHEFLIDRGDLSKETSIEEIPIFQRRIVKDVKSRNKKVYVATNFLESMIDKSLPTRAEANDIYSSLEMGVNGLILAAETAIGKYPLESVNFLLKIINIYKNKKSF
jgi:pyruvate kinase